MKRYVGEDFVGCCWQFGLEKVLLNNGDIVAICQIFTKLFDHTRIKFIRDNVPAAWGKGIRNNTATCPNVENGVGFLYCAMTNEFSNQSGAA